MTHRPITTPLSFVMADDHPSLSLAVRQILTDLLGVRGDQITIVHTSQDLLDVCSAYSACPRIVVLDLVMPGHLKRSALVKAVRKADPNARIVAYSAEASPFLASAVLKAGAMGYVAKSSPTTELAAALVAASHGGTHVDKRIDIERVKTHPWSSLTDSERTVLLAFCRGEKAPHIVARTGRSYSTITTHKYNGLTKLGLRDGTDLLPYLYANGLVDELDSQALCP